MVARAGSRASAPGYAVALLASLLLAACGGPAPSATIRPATASPAAPAPTSSSPTSARPSSSPTSIASTPPVPSNASPSANQVGITVTSALGRTTSGLFSRSTKVPALGQAVTWRFDGGPDLAGRTMRIQSLTALRPTTWTTIATVTADASGIATYTAAFDRPTFLSLRALVPSGDGAAGGSSDGLQASWRGTGACPEVVMAPGPVTYQGPLTTSPGGTHYQVMTGPDAAGDEQSTLTVSSLSDGSTGWTYVFPACQSPSSPVVAADGTAYVLTADPRRRFTSGRLYVFAPAGLRVTRALTGLLGSLVRAPDGTVYLAADEETARPGSSWQGIWHASYLAALDPTGRPKPGWPYVSSVPLSAPSFGASGALYLAAGFQIGLTDVPAAAQRVHTVVALRLDGSLVPGWPFTLPAGTSATLTSISEGNDMVFPQPPIVGSDGTVYVVASKGSWGGDGDLVFALAPGGYLKAGWPYAITLDRGGFLVATGGAPGATPPAIGRDGTVYLAHRVGSLTTGHDEILALAPDGQPRTGRPVALPDRAAPATAACPASGGFYAGCWLRLASDGQLVVHVFTDRPDVTTPVCLAPDGRRVTCSAAASTAILLP